MSFREGERQLADLEARLTAVAQEVGSRSDMNQSASLGETVTTAFEKLNGLLQKHKRLSTIWSQYEEIEKDLQPQVLEELGMTDAVKQEYILADEERIRGMISSLDDFSRLKEYVNTASLQELPTLNSKMKPLEAVHISQTELAAEQHERTIKLLEAYNAIVNMLSKKFVYWDAILSAAEQASV